MTTRRQLFALTAAAGLTTACRPQELPHTTQGPQVSLLARHTKGLGVYDLAAGTWTVPPAQACLSLDANMIVSAEYGAKGTRLSIRRGTQVSTQELDGLWTPRAARDDRVALVQGTEVGDVYRPRGRGATTLLVTGPKNHRYELLGNLEPEAFSPDGSRLYMLDYLPPKAPDIYRVRVFDLASGKLSPLSIKDKGLVPPGAEETMRGQGRHAVYDARNGILFTLYTHPADHRHTGQLLGVRRDAPDVHAFIHALHLADGWAVCIDLPKPFGLGAAAGHALALSPNATFLYAVTGEHGTIVHIDRQALAIKATKKFTPFAGEAAALATVDEQVLVAAGRTITDLTTAWQLDHELHGLTRDKDGLLWTAQDGALTGLDWTTRKQVHRVPVDGIQSVI